MKMTRKMNLILSIAIIAITWINHYYSLSAIMPAITLPLLAIVIILVLIFKHKYWYFLGIPIIYLFVYCLIMNVIGYADANVSTGWSYFIVYLNDLFDYINRSLPIINLVFINYLINKDKLYVEDPQKGANINTKEG